MTRRPSWIVAAQAVVVGVLMVVVFLTLLQPQGSGPLFGIDKPGVAGSANAAHRPDHRAGSPHRRHATRRRGGGHPGGSAIAGTSNPSSTLPPSATPPPATAAPPAGETPTEDQYADTLARLAARLN